MATGSKKGTKKRGYHHGDLRRALTEAAWQLLRKHGLEALTLREVARKVGVTHAAPYHHFPSRDALLDALAEEAFAALDREMSQACEGTRDPAQTLAALGRTYIDHARAHPEHVQVMFRRREATKHVEPDSAGERVFAHLFNAVDACQKAGLAPRGDTSALALSAWSLVHGFAKLWVEGPLEQMPSYGDRFCALRDALLANLGASWRALATLERSCSD